MAVCGACGKEVPWNFAFCPFCGAPLARPGAEPREERKVVSVLFCDLVGFTAASEREDPEDVRARLRLYHARVRKAAEGFGGTVEKFLGDAVFAVFGAPVAHEDDAERAVRAGFAILQAIADLNADHPEWELRVRVGINTGEALVALDAHPERGEGLVTGDMVNTAARIQAAAATQGIACSEQTYRTTAALFDWAEQAVTHAKGKSEPLTFHRPLRPRADRDGTTPRATTPFVGREIERDALIAAFDRAAEDRTSQLVTIVGEPGAGKSRLCAELAAELDRRAQPVCWRQGRCLPYGDGVDFWALGEIVKGACGIFESDGPDDAARKLEAALPPDLPDRAWIRARLEPLIGAGSGTASQAESFNAWHRFLHHLAAERTTVLLFEDVHWGDAALLAFLEQLAGGASEVPLFLLCTARPEIYEQNPRWGATLRNATTINLHPLDREEIARLVDFLAGEELSSETRRVLLERAGGNPLFAEELTALVGEHSDRSADAPAAVPESLHGVIAARLDALAPDHKRLLQNAAVVGEVFWAGAVATMAEGELDAVELALHELSRRELVRLTRGSSMEGETEYAFWHALVRDVCYGQIPRGTRGARHEAAAAWIESRASGRVEDLADVIAHHYVTALDLARAAGDSTHAGELEVPARRFLGLAGERALALDVASAETSFARALELTPPGDPQRAPLLEQWARTALQQGKALDARRALEDAIGLHRNRGDLVGAGRAMSALVTVLWVLGDPDRRKTMDEAIALLEDVGLQPELAAALAEFAGVRFENAEYPESMATAARADELRAELGMPDDGRALGFGGCSAALLGDPQGIEDLRRAISRSTSQGRARDAAVHQGNLAEATYHYAGAEAALEVAREGVEFCEARGVADVALGLEGVMLLFDFDLGTEDVLTRAEDVALRAQATGDLPTLVYARSVQARVSVHRGETTPESAQEAERLAARVRPTGIAWVLGFSLGAAAELFLATGQAETGGAVLDELAAQPAIRRTTSYTRLLPELARLSAAGPSPVRSALPDGFEPRTPLGECALASAKAVVAEYSGDHESALRLHTQAAAGWEQLRILPEHGFALAGRARCLRAAGEPGADHEADQAQAILAGLGYKVPVVEPAG